MHLPAPANARVDPDAGWPHRLHFALLGLAMALGGALALAWPATAASLAPWPMPPLHARCLAALQLALAWTWLRAAAETDRAALRIPLVMSATAGLAMLGAAWGSPGVGTAALPTLALAVSGGTVLASAGLLLWRDRMLQAPAERPHRGLLALAAPAALAAVALLLAPGAAAAWWPWPLAPATALPYAVLLATWSAAAGWLAHERRRSARRHPLQGLLALGGLVPAVSLLHLGAFHSTLAGLAWCAPFAAAAVVAARALRQSWH